MLHIETIESECTEHTDIKKYMFISHIVIVFSFLLLLIHHIVNAKTTEERLITILALIITILISRDTIIELWDMYDEA